MCDKHSLIRHKKTGVNDGILLLLQHPAANRYAMLPQLLLIRGSSGRAGVAACGGSSSSSSSGSSGGGSGAILFLVVVIILLLFAGPPRWHCPSPFRRPLLFLQAAARLPSTRNGWLLFALVYCPLCRRPPSSERR